MPTSLVGSSRGVTLLELLIVVGIIGLMVAIATPAISAGLDSVRMTSATGSVASFLNAALDRAERRQTAVEVLIVPKENALRAYSAEPGFARELHLPDGISIEGDPAVRTLILMPGDSAPGMGIRLANSHGAHRIVRLDPMTGFPHVESVH
jgi:prepilin-type N-terminal cleavage/methylation domain-containing protein